MTRYFTTILKSWTLLTLLPMMLSCGQGNDPTQHDSGPARLLPGAPPAWRDAGRTQVFTGVALSDYINGGAEAYFAYGFREVAVREFENDSGARLTVEIYEMDRPENAYGIFSTDSAGERLPFGADASYGEGLLRFWKGPYFVRILCFPPDPSIEVVIKETGKRIADSIKAESGRPEPLLSLRPEAGVVPDTVCYFHRQTSLNNIRFISDENLLGLGDDIEAITWEEIVAESDGAQSGLRQIALRYPSESEAEAAVGAFAEKYLGKRDHSSVLGAAALVAQVKDGVYAAAGLRSRWAVVILDAPSSETAARALRRTLAGVTALQKPEESS